MGSILDMDLTLTAYKSLSTRDKESLRAFFPHLSTRQQQALTLYDSGQRQIFKALGVTPSYSYALLRSALRILQWHLRAQRNRAKVRDARDLKLDNLDMSVRAFNVCTGWLNSPRITTVGELVDYGESALMLRKNMGRKTCKEIKDLLYGLGLQLRP